MTPASVSTIRSLHWQPALGTEGEVVEGLADIAQCIGTILLTPTRSVPHRPEFGSDIGLYIDQPVTVAVPQIIAAAWVAIERWEPRARIVDIRVTEAPTPGGRLLLTVEWELPAGTGGTTSTQVAV